MIASFASLQRAVNRVTSYFGYDAAETREDRRKPPNGVLQSEDAELPSTKRRKLLSASRDIQRQFAIAGWAVRKHLDFVSSFSFQSRMRDKALDQTIEKRMEEWSEPANCDVAGRHDLPTITRLTEARATVDGDMMLVKLAEGRLQGIEGDRVRSPTLSGAEATDLFDQTGKRTVHGIEIDAAGKALRYAIHKRNGTSFEMERWVSAANVLHHACYDRFDQVRGISPIAAGLNTLRDVYEGFDYALAKAKIAQLFGLKIKRTGTQSLGPVTAVTTDEEEETDRYQIDFGRGPVLLDLDPGDDAEFLENKTPPTEFREFTQAMISVALKALDIPYCFYDEAYTNFFGSRAALLLYLQSAKTKRKKIRRLLRDITRWQLSLWAIDGRLKLPAGTNVEDLVFEWIPDGVPWWDPSKDLAADIAAIGAGLRSRREIRQERYGDDWFDVIDALAEEEDYIEQAGVTITQAPVAVSLGPDQPAKKEEDD